jgi:hypothetical protein
VSRKAGTAQRAPVGHLDFQVYGSIWSRFDDNLHVVTGSRELGKAYVARRRQVDRANSVNLAHASTEVG